MQKDVKVSIWLAITYRLLACIHRTNYSSTFYLMVDNLSLIMHNNALYIRGYDEVLIFCPQHKCSCHIWHNWIAFLHSKYNAFRLSKAVNYRQSWEPGCIQKNCLHDWIKHKVPVEQTAWQWSCSTYWLDPGRGIPGGTAHLDCAWLWQREVKSSHQFEGPWEWCQNLNIIKL